MAPLWGKKNTFTMKNKKMHANQTHQIKTRKPKGKHMSKYKDDVIRVAVESRIFWLKGHITWRGEEPA